MSDTTQLTQREQDAIARNESEVAARRTTIAPAVDIYEDATWSKKQARNCPPGRLDCPAESSRI